MLPVMRGMEQAVCDHGRRGPHYVLFEKRGELAVSDMLPVIPAEANTNEPRGFRAPGRLPHGPDPLV
jgi:hypothetical protein